MIAGSTFVPTLWYTPTRRGAGLAGRVGEQVRSSGLEAVRDRDDVPQQQPAGLRELDGAAAPAAVEQPDAQRRLGPMTCWLTADWV